MATQVRKGQYTGKLERIEFSRRFRNAFFDPAFAPRTRRSTASRRSPGRPTSEGRKAPLTRKAGPGFADPDYELSVEWHRDATSALRAGRRRRWADPTTPIARARDLRLAAQRRHLPGRDLQDLPPRRSWCSEVLARRRRSRSTSST